MHDQKFGTFYSLRPEDDSTVRMSPKNAKFVVSSIVHFKVFKSYFIYIIDYYANDYTGCRAYCKNTYKGKV